jgi:hypothetical protein
MHFGTTGNERSTNFALQFNWTPIMRLQKTICVTPISTTLDDCRCEAIRFPMPSDHIATAWSPAPSDP